MEGHYITLLVGELLCQKLNNSWAQWRPWRDFRVHHHDFCLLKCMNSDAETPLWWGYERFCPFWWSAAELRNFWKTVELSVL